MSKLVEYFMNFVILQKYSIVIESKEYNAHGSTIFFVYFSSYKKEHKFALEQLRV